MLSENDLELLSAYLDGALSESERAALEARLQAEPELQRELARLRATIDLVGTLPTLTPPRPLTLTPRMVRRPSVLTSATFSMLSTAAAVILLVIGAALFTTTQNHPGAPASAALSRIVAILPTDTLPALTGTSAKLAGNASEANVPLTQATEAQAQNDFLQAAPTETQQLLFSAQSPQESDADQQAQNGVIQPQAQSALDNSPSAATPPPIQQAAPLAMSSGTVGGAAGAAVAPAPAVVQLPTDTPTPANTPTNTPSSTATASPTDTATPTPAPVLTSLPSAETGTVGIGLIAAAIVLLIAAVVTTILRRRA
ncbi:MAG TPA: zf-HC2 domain-containing protein [Phototrophicaceae bacterium]|nr:zf-HC2 domain-containing protein [Phototrophicaceae bacterium]